MKSLQNAGMDSGKGQELCTWGKLYDKIGLYYMTEGNNAAAVHKA